MNKYFKSFKNLYLFSLFCLQVIVAGSTESSGNLYNNINVTIFIHGTHTKFLSRVFRKYICLKEELVKLNVLEKRCFYKRLMKILTDVAPDDMPFDSFYLFGWSGQLSHKERLRGAKKLYESIKKLIADYKKLNLNPKITLITHSHGGNVALNLANWVEPQDNDFQIDRVVLLGCPIQETTKKFASNKIFKKIYNIYSKMDMIQILDLQKFHKGVKHNSTPLFSQRLLNIAENIKQAKIKFNNRALMHIEFILGHFLRILPSLINEMDKLDSNVPNYLIKINSNKKDLKTIDAKTPISKATKAMNQLKEKKRKSIDLKNELNENVTIFVHGTRTISKLYLKYSDEINLLQDINSINKKYRTYKIATALSESSNDFNLNSFYVFGWSGKLCPVARKEAGQKLYDCLTQLNEQYNKNGITPKFTIVCHSHGGNVALNMAEFINEKSSINIDKLVLLGCPIQESSNLYAKSKIFNRVYNIYSGADVLQVIDPQRLHSSNKKLPFFSQKTLEVADNIKQAKIKINNRALCHIEFLFKNFLKHLSNLINQMNSMSNNKMLIKINTK